MARNACKIAIELVGFISDQSFITNSWFFTVKLTSYSSRNKTLDQTYFEQNATVCTTKSGMANVYLLTKGQIISICLFSVFNSPKKRTCFCPSLNISRSFFLVNWKHQIFLSKLTDLYTLYSPNRAIKASSIPLSKHANSAPVINASWVLEFRI